MNKNYISWIHYVYITITATVLAYVTVMDTPSKSSDESAVNMLPSINETETETEPKTETEPETETEPKTETEAENQNSVMSYFNTTPSEEDKQIETPQIAIAEPIEQPPVVKAEPIEEPRTDIPKGGNMNKTRLKKQKQNKNKTRNRK
jgi:hypothetical protein